MSFEKKVDEVPPVEIDQGSSSGKSTLQNEILGDLQLEFTSAPEKGEEMLLEELGSACRAKHGKEVYYQFEDNVEASIEDVPTPEQCPAPPVALMLLPAPATFPVSSSPAATIEDVPIKATGVLTVIVAQKLKKKVDEVPLSKSIKDLVGGESTLQNEILGDLQLKFMLAPEKGEEMPLEELGSALGVGFGGSLGKYSYGLVSHLIGGKKSTYLRPSRADGVLLGLTMEPMKRLGSEAEAKSWLDGVVSVYTQGHFVICWRHLRNWAGGRCHDQQ